MEVEALSRRIELLKEEQSHNKEDVDKFYIRSCIKGNKHLLYLPKLPNFVVLWSCDWSGYWKSVHEV